MKLVLLALLVLCTSATIIKRPIDVVAKDRRLGSRQLQGLFDAFVPTLSPATRDKVTPQFRKEATREIIRYGPVKVYGTKSSKKGASLDPGGTDFIQVIKGICSDCMILSAATSITFENKTTASLASGLYNHHIAIFDLGKSVPFVFQCSTTRIPEFPGFPNPTPSSSGVPSSGTAASAPQGSPKLPDNFQLPNLPISIVFGSGHDDSSIDYASKNSSINTGYYISKNDILAHYTEFVNYREEDQDVYITMEIEYVPGWPAGYSDAIPSTASATGCAPMMWMPPKNQTSVSRSPPYLAGVGGYMFDMKAHLHDGGTSVRVFVNNKLACDSRAIYGGANNGIDIRGHEWDTIVSYEKCSTPVRVEKGDEVVVEGTYDTINHPLRPGSMDSDMMGEAMGLIGFVFAPDNNRTTAA